SAFTLALPSWMHNDPGREGDRFRRGAACEQRFFIGNLPGRLPAADMGAVAYLPGRLASKVRTPPSLARSQSYTTRVEEVDPMADVPTIAWPLSAGQQPRVYMVTLGTFEVYVDRQPAPWKAGAAGAGQLQRAVAYLVAHRDRLVRKEV